MIKLYEGENDRVKLMVLFCGEEDPELRLAAAGAIAMISSLPSIAKKIIEVGISEVAFRFFLTKHHLKICLLTNLLSFNSIQSQRTNQAFDTKQVHYCVK